MDDGVPAMPRSSRWPHGAVMNLCVELAFGAVALATGVGLSAGILFGLLRLFRVIG